MKTIAAICMLIDHIGMAFFPCQISWRVIGRLAMPIFSFGIARGIFYTSSIKNYMKRLGIFALTAQLPFWLLSWVADGGTFFSLHLNIGFTFLSAVLVIYLWQQLNSQEALSKKMRIKLAGGCVMILLLADLLGMDYGSYGILVTAACYHVIKNNSRPIMLYMFYTLLTLLFFGSTPMLFLLQEAGVLGFVIVGLMKHISEKRMSRFFYVFYPVHMLVIGLVGLWS